VGHRLGLATRTQISVCKQRDHLYGKPGDVREFDGCWGNVGDFTKSQGNVGKNLVREKLPETIYCKLHI